MARGLAIFLLLLVVAALAAAGALAYRTSVVAWVAAQQIEQLGVPDAELTVADIGWRQARVTAIKAGRQGELAAAELVVDYRPGELLTGRLEQVAVKGLSLRLDLSGGAPLGSLQAPLEALMSGPGDSGAERAAPPRVVLEGARIDALTPVGPAVLELDGRVEPGSEGVIMAEVQLALSGTAGRLLGRLRAEAAADGAVSGVLKTDGGAIALGDEGLSAEVSPGELTFALRGKSVEALKGQLALGKVTLAGARLGAAALSLDGSDSRLQVGAKLGGSDETFGLKFQGEVEDPLDTPKLDATLEFNATAEAPVWELLPLPRPSAGRGTISLELGGVFPDLAAPAPGPSGWIAWLAGGDLQGEAMVEAEGIEVPGAVRGLRARLPIEARAAAGEVKLDVLLDAALDMPSRTLEEMGLPAQALGERLEVKLGGSDSEPLTLHLKPRKDATAVALVGRAVLNAPEHLKIEATGTVSGDLGPGGATALRLQGVELAARSPALAGITDLAFSSELSGRLALAYPDDGAATTLEHDLVLAPATLGLGVQREGESPLTLETGFARLALTGGTTPDGYGGTARLEGGRAAVPELALAVESLSAEAPLDAAGLAGTIGFAVDAVRDLQEPPRFHPISLSGRIAPRGEAYALTAEAEGPAGAGKLRLAGSLEPAADRGQLRATLESIEFAPGGLQPAAFSPLLAGLEKVTGRIEGGGQAVWDSRGLRSSAALGVNGLSFLTEGFQVKGLRLALKLDDLLAPSSPPGQLLVAEQIDPGVPIEDVSARFRLRPGNPAVLAVERADFAMAGGRYRLEDAAIDLGRTAQELSLQVVDLDLARLFDLLQIDGLDGTGHLNGAVPLRIDGDSFSVAEASLRARAPGLLRFQSEAATQALRGGGEPVELMLQALEDFHYDSLTVTASMTEAGEAQLRVELLGRNPAVRGGHPFRFNINLTGNLAPLLEAMSQGYGISSDILRRAWRLRP